MIKSRCLILSFLALVASWWMVGCSRNDSTPLASELDEPYYRQGQQLAKQGRYQEALTAYLKVISKRNEDAPESHLEVGAIYLKYIRNYIAAIYHFNKYLELQPNSRQAALVRQQIDGAKREFARTLPAQPAELADDREDLQSQIAKLQQENDRLKAELATNRNAASATTSNALTEPLASNHEPVLQRAPVNLLADSDAPVGLTSAPMVSTQIGTPVVRGNTTTRAPATRAVPTRAPASTPTTATARRHVVAVKDSLWSIARKYYGAAATSAKVQGILDANRDVLPNAAALKPGMEIKIP